MSTYGTTLGFIVLHISTVFSFFTMRCQCHDLCVQYLRLSAFIQLSLFI